MVIHGKHACEAKGEREQIPGATDSSGWIQSEDQARRSVKAVRVEAGEPGGSRSSGPEVEVRGN